jgi:hypothetical protein
MAWTTTMARRRTQVNASNGKFLIDMKREKNRLMGKH